MYRPTFLLICAVCLAAVFPMPAHALTPATTPTFPAPASEKVKGTPTTTYTPSTATTPTVGGLSTSTTPRAPAKATTGKGNGGGLSSAAIAIAALAALLLAACIAWALARRSVFEPHWLLSLRHSLSEAGFRVSATWSEFTDWMRLGH